MWAMWLSLAPVVAAAAVAADAGDEPGYELRLAPPAVTAEVGADGAISLTIAPAAGHSIDRDGPVRIDVRAEPVDGLALPRRRYRRADAADARADAPRFDLRYRAVAAGDYTVAIDARFWVCRKYTCRAVRDRREVPVRVTAPAPPPPEHDAGPAAPR